ncbi:hypothetical protein OU426_10875 [Frigidibacter sp. RF13]|uniref:hypothetical protein n=1 Tax=Frigidibacter sp. RF13 TaxID=2997340 RepID=UPI002271C756|nr:hypothetical protein [Frigidibacter sp. RF13]MCY1127356.1 hypothetical protein [Frigidibacter sp. RF13]
MVSLLLSLSAAPLAAETTAPADPSAEEGMSLIDEGIKIILRALLDDVQPKMEELQKGLDEALAEMGPALKDLLLKIDDFRNYHPPEVLPNGDIIIRRKTPAEIENPDGQIEL